MGCCYGPPGRPCCVCLGPGPCCAGGCCEPRPPMAPMGMGYGRPLGPPGFGPRFWYKWKTDVNIVILHNLNKNIFVFNYTIINLKP